MGRKSSNKRRPASALPAGDPSPGRGPDTPGGRATSWTRRDLLWGALLVACVLVAYTPALGGDFVWDDDVYVINADTLRDLEGLKRIWVEPTSIPQYYPLVHTTFWLEYQAWGLETLGYHLVNVFVHGLSAFVLWRVLLRLGVPGAWLAAAVFALHPVHVESVAWITQRKNVLSGLFYLLAAWAYLRFRPMDDPRGVRQDRLLYYQLAWLAFVAALLSKTVTASLPAGLLVVAWWKRREPPWRDAVYLAPMLVVGAVMGLTTAYLEKIHVGAEGIDWELSVVERALVAGRALWFYAGKLVWPARLTFIYPRWVVDDTVWWQYLFPLAAAAVVGALVVFRGRIGRAPLAALLFFAVTLFPALGFVDVYPFRYSFVADHFQYLGSLGVIVLVVGLGTWVAARLPEATRLGLGLGVLAVLGVLTWRQAHVYQGLEPLWQDTIAKDPRSWMAHNNLAGLRMDEGRLDEALEHYMQTVEFKPDHPNAPNNLGQIHLVRGDLDEAERWLRRATEIDVDFAPPHVNLAAVYGRRGQPELAEQHLRQAIAIGPGFPLAHHELGLHLMRVGRLDEAIRSLQTAVDQNRIDPMYRTQLGIALTRAGDTDRALEHLEAAARLQPDDVGMHYNLAVALKAAGRVEEAVVALQTAVRLGPEEVEPRVALAEAQADTGRLDEATASAQEALNLARQAGRNELAAQLTRQLAEYQARR